MEWTLSIGLLQQPCEKPMQAGPVPGRDGLTNLRATEAGVKETAFPSIQKDWDKYKIKIKPK
jgi:hypothetical protein